MIERGGYKDMDACVMYAISPFRPTRPHNL